MINKSFNSLLNASQHGWPDKVQMLLEEDVDLDPNDRDGGGATPLIRCVQGMLQCSPELAERRVACVRLLVQNGADMELLDGSGRNALEWAVFVRSKNMVEELLRLGANAAFFDDKGHTAVHFAVKAGALETLSALVNNGPEKLIDTPNQVGSTALSYAAQNGDVEACRILLNLGADVNAQDVIRPKRTPLHYAIYNSELDVFKLLLNHGALPDIKDYKKRRVVHKAAVTPDPRYISALCEAATVATMETPNEEGATSLMLACQKEAVDQVDALLNKKVALDTQDLSGKTALHYCVENGKPELADRLIKARPSLVDVKDGDGYSALQLAVMAGNSDMTDYFLKNGADKHTRDNEEHTIAHWATVCGHVDLIDNLHDNGADLSQPDVHEAYPLHYAAQMCGVKNEETKPETGLLMLDKLLSKKVPVDVEDRDKRQPLLWAASAGSAEACQVLLEAGADPEACDKDGLTALHCAASRGYETCIEVVQEKNGKVDAEDKNGCTPLFYAMTLDHRQCADMLLKKGANASHQDKKGRSPAHCAAAKGAEDNLQMIAENNGDLWQQNAKGEYPIHEACLAKQTSTVGFLLDKTDDKSKVNITNQDGRTCLHIAALTNNLELCKLLIERDADPKCLMEGKRRTMKAGERQLTPYEAALLKGSEECAEYLKKFVMDEEEQEEEQTQEEEPKEEPRQETPKPEEPDPVNEEEKEITEVAEEQEEETVPSPEPKQETSDEEVEETEEGLPESVEEQERPHSREVPPLREGSILQEQEESLPEESKEESEGDPEVQAAVENEDDSTGTQERADTGYDSDANGKQEEVVVAPVIVEEPKQQKRPKKPPAKPAPPPAKQKKQQREVTIVVEETPKKNKTNKKLLEGEQSQHKRRAQSSNADGRRPRTVCRRHLDPDSQPMRHVLKQSLKMARRNYKHEIQELVRIFECKTLASASINKSRKLMLYNTYRGGMPEKAVVGALQEEYNKKAREPVQAPITSEEQWEQHLQDILSQAEADEKALKQGWKEKPGKSDDFRNSPSASPRDDKNQGSPSKSQRKRDALLDWDKPRRTAWESMQEDKLIKAYSSVLPGELPQYTPASSRPAQRRQSWGRITKGQKGVSFLPPIKESDSEETVLPPIEEGTRGRPARSPRSRHRSNNSQSGSSTGGSSNTLPNINRDGQKDRTAQQQRSYSAAPPTSRRGEEKLMRPGFNRSKTSGASGTRFDPPRFFTPRYDGQFRPRRQLQFMAPEDYSKKRRAQLYLKRTQNREEFMDMLTELLEGDSK